MEGQSHCACACARPRAHAIEGAHLKDNFTHGPCRLLLATPGTVVQHIHRQQPDTGCRFDKVIRLPVGDDRVPHESRVLLQLHDMVVPQPQAPGMLERFIPENAANDGARPDTNTDVGQRPVFLQAVVLWNAVMAESGGME